VDALDKTVSSIKELQADVFANPTKKNVEQLKKLVGEYTSMKKEIAVALYAIQEAKKNKDAGDYISQVL
jgi:ribosomal protein L29